MRRAFPIALLALAVAQAACVARGVSGRPAEAPGDLFHRAWTVPLETAGEVQLEAAPGGFVVASPAGKIHLVTAANGSVAWRTDFGASIAGAVVVAAPGSVPTTESAPAADGAWVAAPVEGDAVAVARIGSPDPPRLLKTGLRSVVLSAVGANLFIHSIEGGAALVSLADGNPIWKRRLPPAAGVQSVVCGDRLLVGCADGHLLGVEIASGKIAWGKQLGSPLAAAPACAENHALAATADNVLHALRLHRRSAGIMWRTRSGADPAAPPLFVGRQALLISKDTFLYGFGGGNGHLAFRARLNRRPGPAALLKDLLLIAGPHATRLDAIQLPAGRSAGGFDLPEGTRFITPPIVSEGKVAIAFARYGEEACRLVALAAGGGSG